MKKLKSFLVFTIFLTIAFLQPTSGQSRSVEEFSFGLRVNDPVVMDVVNSGDKVTFNALNKSYFPYDLTLKFSQIQNLFPPVFERKILLQPGNNMLFVLSVKDKTQSVLYEYSFTYIMRLSDSPDLSFPYLIPIGKGKMVQLRSSRDGNIESVVFNQFMMNSGDTVFAVRKGTITALPDDESRTDRIIKTLSLEVLHADGTLAIYRGLVSINNQLHTGQTVYPGQPIGIVNEKGSLTINLVAMLEPAKLKSLEMFYCGENKEIISSKNIMNKRVFYPREIVKKEMTEREIKKFEKGKLF